MPLVLSPNSKFSLALKSDQHLPAESQPRFIFRAFDGHEQQRIAARFDELEKLRVSTEANTADYVAQIFELAKLFIVGWENMGGLEFAPEKIADVLQYREALELIYRAWGFSPADLKNSASQSPSASDASVNPPDVPAAQASAKNR